MKILIGIFILFLGACTTTADLQNQCAATADTFQDEVLCLEGMVSQQESMKNDSFTKEYVLTGRLLAQRLNQGEISEEEARVLFARKYNQLQIEQQRLNTLNAVELQALSPRYQECEIEHDRVRCNRY